MLRHHARADAATRARIAVRLLYSVRTRDDVIDREELERLGAQPEVDVTLTLTRETPDGWAGRLGRVDRAMLEAVSWAPTLAPRIFVCGPTPFVEAVATLLVEMGHDPLRVHTERFGPTG
jgi:ferredoxin-NADP reductase